MADFHEVRFPVDVALGARGGPERRTDIVTLGSGREHRNARWADSRRRYDAGYGVKTLDALAQVVSFFEERRGRLHGFRWRDRLDDRSCAPSMTPSAVDQSLGVGDGALAVFQLAKTYGGGFAPWTRSIRKPVAGSVRVAVNGVEAPPAAFATDHASGQVVFAAGHAPLAGASVTAGFLFDVPVRFDADALDIDLAAFAAGDIPSIPVVEILP